MPFPGRRHLTAAAFVLAAGLTGCTKPPPSASPTGREAGGPAADPWEAAVKRVGQDKDPVSLRTTLGKLSGDLAGQPGGLPTLTPDGAKALAAAVTLTPFEAEQVGARAFTGLDAVYLADALYLRDAARWVDPGGAAPAELARLGFEWVCRQVFVFPWVLDTGELVPAVPPTAVLRRGYGTGLERAYVFLALLRQLGIDGCLVGPPEAADRPAGYAGPGETGVPRGPFWAVGARVGPDVLLFDPWAGRPVPGPGGTGIATLAQVRADPALAKPVAPDEARRSVAFLAVPVGGLSPRMAVLEEKLRAEVGVRLAADPAALRGRFAEAKEEPRVWHPKGDDFAYGRVQARFTPAEDGGLDARDPRSRLQGQYLRSLLPGSVLVFPAGLAEVPSAGGRLRNLAIDQFATAFLNPPGGQPGPRERVQRGQLQDAVRFLTDRQDGFRRGLERLQGADRGEEGAWVRAMAEAHAALTRAQFPDPLRDKVARPDSDPAVADAQRAVDDLWRSGSPFAQRIVDRAAAAPGLAEASYLIALAKHEEAERRQFRADRAGAGPDAEAARKEAARAWGEAANQWATFLAQPVARGFPARADHAQALAARAAAAAGAK
ncbi:MAG: hypothetical protein K2X82_20740 [Gemmataceae bacterium]|nr:hypothetical protein [Gemmataceae bacterium]